MRNRCLVLGVMAVALVSCRSAYYGTMEKFGVYKRDILKKRVVAARDEQHEASKEFKDALTRLKELYAFKGGDLEKLYNQLNGDYEQSQSRAEAVRKRIRDVESVADDLFREWESEAGQISSVTLRASSREQLSQTKARYDELHRALVRAEKTMEPVLVKLHDHVLYLKHNLNAQAISALRGEAVDIQKEIGRLIDDMNASIAKADEFIRNMPQ